MGEEGEVEEAEEAEVAEEVVMVEEVVDLEAVPTLWVYWNDSLNYKNNKEIKA